MGQPLECRVKWIEFSTSIFYTDLTYTFSDAIREYDVLLYACCNEFNGNYIVLPGEDVSSTHEVVKDFVDYVLGPSTVFFINRDIDGFSGKLYGSSLVLNKGLYNVLIDSFIKYLGLNILELNNAIKMMRRACSELANLTYFLQLYVNRGLTRKILNDWKKYVSSSCFEGNGYEELVKTCMSYYSMLLGLTTITETEQKCVSSDSLRRLIKERTVKDIKVELLDYLRRELCSGKWVLLVFPQYLKTANSKSESKPVRLMYMAKTIDELVKRLSSDGCDPTKIFIMGNQRIWDLVVNLEKLLKDKERKINITHADVEKEEVFKEIVDVNKIVIVVLQDYRKDYLTGFMRKVIEKAVKPYNIGVLVIVIPETFYDISGRNVLEKRNQQYKIEKVMEAYSGFGHRRIDKLSIFRVALLNENDLAKIVESLL